MKRFDICVIGGGIVGLATARALLEKFPKFNVIILEKESGAGRHQSTHNSGVLHAGLYYKPGSLKARLAVKGIREMTAFCQRNDIPHEICGKIVVATTEEEIVRLQELLRRGEANGLRDLAWLDQRQLREREPHAAGLAALHVPEEGIVDYEVVCAAMLRDFEKGGGIFAANSRVIDLKELSGGWRIMTPQTEFEAGFLVNCAGLFCDRIAKLAGVVDSVRIVPFRGEYYHLSTKAASLVKHLIYPVPDLTFPFLGVHFTRLIRGGVEAGPNAVLALAREGYRKIDFDLHDFTDAILFPGTWNFLRRHPSMCGQEALRSLSKSLFTKSLQRLVPDVRSEHLTPGGAGVRAQAMQINGTLVQDFWIKQQNRALHVLNAPSPAATASLAIAAELAAQINP